MLYWSCARWVVPQVTLPRREKVELGEEVEEGREAMMYHTYLEAEQPSTISSLVGLIFVTVTHTSVALNYGIKDHEKRRIYFLSAFLDCLTNVYVKVHDAYNTK